MIKQFLAVGVGGALGSILRYGASLLYSNKTFPYTTLLINIVGSFVIGIAIAYSVKSEAAGNWKLFLATGLCGGFTTFSAFSFENLLMIQNGKWLLSLLYITGSVVTGIVAAWLGYKLIN